jgi:hypothetical protein
MEVMTQSEKIEDLRTDVKRIFRLLNEFKDAIARAESNATSWLAEAEDRVDQFGRMVNGVSRNVGEIEQRIRQLER